MVNVDMKNLLMRLNGYCTNVLQSAAGLCVSRTHYEITVEHYIVKLIEDNRSDWPLIFQQFDIDAGRASVGDDRIGVDQRLLQLIHRFDVPDPSFTRHGHADAHTGKQSPHPCFPRANFALHVTGLFFMRT